MVLVTGAARRVGRAIALELAAHGFDLALHAHQTSAEAAETRSEALLLGARAEVFAADLADESACRALLPAVVESMGRCDAVVNNASRFEYDGIEDFKPASLAAHLQVNTVAPLLLAQALHAHLGGSGHGSDSGSVSVNGHGHGHGSGHGSDSGSGRQGCVVNLLDQKLWNLNPDHLSYTLSKAALAAATTLLAQALAPSVRVVGVAPGITLPSGPMSEHEFDRARRMTPLGYSCSAEDVAKAVRFLIESRAITGTTLLVDGGQHLLAQPRDVLYLARAEAST